MINLFTFCFAILVNLPPKNTMISTLKENKVDISLILSLTYCELNSDCDLPMICCESIFFDFKYCCDIGARTRSLGRKFPNNTMIEPVMQPI